MFTPTREGWAAACLIGFGTWFLAFSVTGLFQRLLWRSPWPDVTALPSLDPATGFGGVDPEIVAEMYRANGVYHVVHIPAFGGLIEWLQWKVLRRTEVRPVPWVTLTALAFEQSGDGRDS